MLWWRKENFLKMNSYFMYRWRYKKFWQNIQKPFFFYIEAWLSELMLWTYLPHNPSSKGSIVFECSYIWIVFNHALEEFERRRVTMWPQIIDLLHITWFSYWTKLNTFWRSINAKSCWYNINDIQFKSKM